MVERVAAAPREGAAEDDYRLRADGPGRRVQVVSFVLQFRRRWGRSPSLSTIGAGVGCSKDTAAHAVRRAVRAGDLVRASDGGLEAPASTIAVPPRVGPENAAALIAELRAAGYIIDGSFRELDTLCPLPDERELDHIPAHADEQSQRGSDTATR